MKRFFAAFAAILAISSMAFAGALMLPDYEKNDVLIDTFGCDGGTTDVKEYNHEDWNVIVIRPASSEIFVDMASKNGPGFFMQAAGSTEMKAITQKEFNEALAKSSPASFSQLRNRKSDCKRK